MVKNPKLTSEIHWHTCSKCEHRWGCRRLACAPPDVQSPVVGECRGCRVKASLPASVVESTT